MIRELKIDEIEEAKGQKAYDKKKNQPSRTAHVVFIEFSGKDFLHHGEKFLYHIKKFAPEGNHHRKKSSQMEKDGIDSGGFAAVSGKMLVNGKMSA